jgi:hypothetical protein
MVVSRDILGPEQCDSCIALALHRHSRFFLLLMRENVVRRRQLNVSLGFGILKELKMAPF